MLFSDLVKLIHGEYSQYQLYSSKFDMTHVYIQFFKEKLIQGDQDTLRHPQQPHQAQPWRVQQVPVMFTKNWHSTC